MPRKLQGRAVDSNSTIIVNNISFGSNVAVNTTVVALGNSTVNTYINSTSVTTTSLVGNGASITSVDAATLGGNTASTLRSYSDTVAATAFSNAATRADSAYTNAASYADTKAGQAYSNAIAYSGNAAQAYSNATTFSSNADNISSGTLNTARLPATVNVQTVINVGANVNVNTSAVLIGNSTVNTVISAETILINGVNINTAITSNAATAYSNAIAYSGNAVQAYNNAIAYAAANSYVNNTFLPLAGGTMAGNLTVNASANIVSNLSANNVTFRGDVQIDGNLVVSGTSVTLNVASFTVEDNILHLNNGSTNTHPDLGLAGNYNDGTYKHAGIFRDATDGVWKVFDGYTPEPNTAFIDTSNASFRIANFTANVITANSFTGNGASITSVDAATVGGNTASALRSYSDTVAATAFSNAALRADAAYSNAIAYSGNAALAFSNAAARADAAYTNATSYASNATNISSGTLDTARLPATVNVSTVLNVGANVSVNTSALFVGNSTVNSVLTATSLSVGGNTATFGSAAYVVANGNVGIGNTTPGEKLVINGTTRMYGSNGATMALFAHRFADGSQTRTFNIIAPASESTIVPFVFQTGNALEFIVDSSSVLYLSDNYNVGIGNTAPNAKLQVTGTANISGNVALGGDLTVAGTLTVKAISSNGSVGTAGQLLASNGTSTYWIDPPASTNVNAQYAWTNTHTFSNTITFGNGTVNSVITSTSLVIGGNTLTVGTTAYYTSNGFIGLGTSSPNAVIEVVSPATSRIAAGQYSFVFRGENNNERLAVRSTADAVLIAQKFNGTYASPTAVTSGQNLGGFQAGGYNGTIFTRGMQIRGLAAGNWSNTSTPSDITFQTVPVDSTSLIDRVTIAANGNVGIGTTTPGTLLQVVGGTIQQYRAAGDNNGLLVSGGDANNSYVRLQNSFATVDYGQGPTAAFVNVNNNQPWYVSVSGASRLWIANTGNIGIGNTTPSYKLQVNNPSASATGDSLSIQNSGVVNLGDTVGVRFRYVTAEPAAIRSVLTNLSTGAGDLAFYTSPDGSGANLAHRMRIDNDGRFMLNTTTANTTANTIMTVKSFTANTNGATFEVQDSNGTTRSTISDRGAQNWFIQAADGLEKGSIRYGTPGGFVGILYFDSTATTRSDFRHLSGGGFTWNAHALGTVPPELMRLDANGSLSIGTTTPGGYIPKLTVNGGRSYFYSINDQYAIGVTYNSSTTGFWLGADSNSDFTLSGWGGGTIMKATSRTGSIAGGTAGNSVGFAHAGIWIDRTWADYPGISVMNQNAAGNGQQGQFRFHGTNATFNSYPTASGSDFSVQVWSDGGFFDASDRRFKTNITTIPNALNKVLSMTGRRFQFLNSMGEIESYHTQNGYRFGFIAQELQDAGIDEVYRYHPEDDDGTDGYNKAYAVHYGSLTALLVEAIKDLKAELNTAVNRIAQLENK